MHCTARYCTLIDYIKVNLCTEELSQERPDRCLLHTESVEEEEEGHFGSVQKVVGRSQRVALMQGPEVQRINLLATNEGGVWP